MERHINARNAMALFVEKTRGVSLSPAEKLLRRLERQQARAVKRQNRHASYPYSSTRQHARYARQIANGQLRDINGLVV